VLLRSALTASIYKTTGVFSDAKYDDNHFAPDAGHKHVDKKDERREDKRQNACSYTIAEAGNDQEESAYCRKNNPENKEKFYDTDGDKFGEREVKNTTKKVFVVHEVSPFGAYDCQAEDIYSTLLHTRCKAMLWHWHAVVAWRQDQVPSHAL
jgi:hypothetical protein